MGHNKAEEVIPVSRWQRTRNYCARVDKMKGQMSRQQSA